MIQPDHGVTLMLFSEVIHGGSTSRLPVDLSQRCDNLTFSAIWI